MDLDFPASVPRASRRTRSTMRECYFIASEVVDHFQLFGLRWIRRFQGRKELPGSMAWTNLGSSPTGDSERTKKGVFEPMTKMSPGLI